MRAEFSEHKKQTKLKQKCWFFEKKSTNLANFQLDIPRKWRRESNY